MLNAKCKKAQSASGKCKGIILDAGCDWTLNSGSGSIDKFMRHMAMA
jgi:hypothetical protein